MQQASTARVPVDHRRQINPTVLRVLRSHGAARVDGARLAASGEGVCRDPGCGLAVGDGCKEERWPCGGTGRGKSSVPYDLQASK